MRNSYLNALLLTLWAGLAQADIQPLETIGKAAETFAIRHAQNAGYQEVSAEARRLDNRLRLPLCPQPLETFASQPQRTLGATTVGVRCADNNKPWTLYVGVTTSAFREIPVLATPLARGAIVQLSDLRFIRQSLDQSQQRIFTDPTQIVGKQLKRPAAEGVTLNPRMLQSPKIIKRGQQITLIAGGDGLQVRMAGKAMASGAAGERITVKNLSSGNLVQGIIDEDGTVKVF